MILNKSSIWKKKLIENAYWIVGKHDLPLESLQHHCGWIYILSQSYFKTTSYLEEISLTGLILKSQTNSVTSNVSQISFACPTTLLWCVLSHVWLFATLWTIEPLSPKPPSVVGRFFTTELPRKPPATLWIATYYKDWQTYWWTSTLCSCTKITKKKKKPGFDFSFNFPQDLDGSYPYLFFLLFFF